MQAGNVTTGVPNTKAPLGFYSQGNKTGYKPVGYLLNEDCEGAGTPAGWTNTDGTPNWDYTAAPLAGAQSLYLSTNGSAGRTRVDFANVGELWVYFKYKLTNGTVPSASQHILGLAANGGGVVVNAWDLTTTLNLRLGSAGLTTTDALALDTLYHVWIYYRKDTGFGQAASVGFSTDGIRPFSGNKYVFGTGGVTTIDMGRAWFGTNLATTGLDQILDDLRISDKPIGDYGLLLDNPAPTQALNSDLNDTLGLLSLSSTGTVGGAVNADLNQTLGALSLSSTVTVTVAANLADTLGTLALTSADTLPVAANESSTLGTASLSSAGTVIVAANLSDTLGTLGLSAAGAAIVAADLNQALGLLGLTSDGTVVTAGGTVNADLSVTLGGLLLSADAVALEHEPGGISGYLKAEKIRYRGANLMLEPMSESTRRAEKIMAGWRDEEEAMMLVQIIETFYD